MQLHNRNHTIYSAALYYIVIAASLATGTTGTCCLQFINRPSPQRELVQNVQSNLEENEIRQ